MRKPMRGDMPIALTLPLHFDLRIRARRRRRLTIAALLALAAAVVAAGFWLPARADLAPPTRADIRLGQTTQCDAALRDAVVGDELSLQQSDGTVRIYEVTALDVVDRARVEFPRDDERYVALMTCWSPAGASVGGDWLKVVTARLRSSPQPLGGGI